jgi:hypothetical protein
MNHLNDEQLTLYYYGETAPASGIEEHLGVCESCRLSYQNLQRVLNSVDSYPIPERDAGFEDRVWKALEHRLESRSFATHWDRWKIAASLAVAMLVVVVAFLAGRTWRTPPPAPRPIADASQVRERVLLVAVGDHLERSQMVLIELANARGLDISYEQKAAEDLLESNRLYRQTAATAGDVATATLLEELERVLLEIAHSPSAVSGHELEDLRKRIEDRGILFKVKVYGSQVEERAGNTPVRVF